MDSIDTERQDNHIIGPCVTEVTEVTEVTSEEFISSVAHMNQKTNLRDPSVILECGENPDAITSSSDVNISTLKTSNKTESYKNTSIAVTNDESVKTIVSPIQIPMETISMETITNNESESHQVADKTENPRINIPKRRIAYLYSDEYVRSCNRLTKIGGRASLVHGLIEAYDLLECMNVVKPQPASKEDLLTFHTEDYIECLHKLSEQADVEKYDDEAEIFGLTYDCPAFPGVYDYSSLIAGATLQAAEELNSRRCQIAVNWSGGWHHAAKDHADGFCYLNDIVLGILKLRQVFERVLYVDLDLHHGDAVQDAFAATPKVVTWSLHKYSPGFFPGTGKRSDVGLGRGKYFCVNSPLLDGINDEDYYRVFQRIAAKLKEQFDPKVVVVQLGADGLNTDMCNSFNLTEKVYADCVKYMMKWSLPMLLLGGGGYNLADTARCWTYITSVLCETELDEEIPDHDYLMQYGPDYSLFLSPGNRTNDNTNVYIDDMLEEVLENLDEIVVS